MFCWDGRSQSTRVSEVCTVRPGNRRSPLPRLGTGSNKSGSNSWHRSRFSHMNRISSSGITDSATIWKLHTSGRSEFKHGPGRTRRKLNHQGLFLRWHLFVLLIFKVYSQRVLETRSLWRLPDPNRRGADVWFINPAFKNSTEWLRNWSLLCFL